MFLYNFFLFYYLFFSGKKKEEEREKSSWICCFLIVVAGCKATAKGSLINLGHLGIYFLVCCREEREFEEVVKIVELLGIRFSSYFAAHKFAVNEAF